MLRLSLQPGDVRWVEDGTRPIRGPCTQVMPRCQLDRPASRKTDQCRGCQWLLWWGLELPCWDFLLGLVVTYSGGACDSALHWGRRSNHQNVHFHASSCHPEKTSPCPFGLLDGQYSLSRPSWQVHSDLWHAKAETLVEYLIIL